MKHPRYIEVRKFLDEGYMIWETDKRIMCSLKRCETFEEAKKEAERIAMSREVYSTNR